MSQVIRFRDLDAAPLDRTALFLDLDGTVLPFRPDPASMVADSRVKGLLYTLEVVMEGRLAVVSGRAIGDVDRVLDTCIECVAGNHGRERRTRWGQHEAIEPHPELPMVQKLISAFAERWPGLAAELKPFSIALHYRGAPGAEQSVRDLARALADATGMDCQGGEKVVELLTPGPDKGDAVRALMTQPPFRGATPIFIGDDLTDEAAFKAVSALGGFGVCVGPRWRRYATARLDGPDDVLGWLAASLASGQFQPRGLT